MPLLSNELSLNTRVLIMIRRSQINPVIKIMSPELPGGPAEVVELHVGLVNLN